MNDESINPYAPPQTTEVRPSRILYYCLCVAYLLLYFAFCEACFYIGWWVESMKIKTGM